MERSEFEARPFHRRSAQSKNRVEHWGIATLDRLFSQEKAYFAESQCPTVTLFLLYCPSE
jgi:hypothetical protein